MIKNIEKSKSLHTDIHSCSNAFVERVFSITESIWRVKTEIGSQSSVKAEIARRINFDKDWKRFY